MILELVKRYLRKDEYYTISEYEVNKELTTLLFTFLFTSFIAVLFVLWFENPLNESLIIIGVSIYLFLRYKQRGPGNE
tara:strand:+ start:60 stop:293 length:234 start_codon:yes stop_codon:yes gene_type:complete